MSSPPPQHPQQRYRVIERLAQGGMAEVFRAESAGVEGFKKQVAIKRVLPHLSEKRKFIAMFLDEARLSAHLTHSNCVQVFDIGVGDNAFFIVMEFVDGADLKSVLETLKAQGKRLAVEEAVFIAAQTCEGLAYAHELTDHDGKRFNLVHRDVSPPNVLITKYGEVKIVDFGLAKAAGQLEKSEPGVIKGKFSYLSPEATDGKEVDQRADIFAVGLILWESLTGRRVFDAESDIATIRLVQAAAYTPASRLNPAVPPELDAILAKALARDPAARFQAARDMARALIDFQFRYGKPVSSFTIAGHVQAAMQLRRRSMPPQGSFIDRLIEEALFEFTSLQSDAPPGGGVATSTGSRVSPVSATLGLGKFESVQDWAREIAVGDLRDVPSVTSLADGVLEEGNLAALEDDEPGGSSLPPPPDPAQPTTPRHGPPPLQVHGSAASGRSGAWIAAGVVAALLAVAGIAYYAGVLTPH